MYYCKSIYIMLTLLDYYLLSRTTCYKNVEKFSLIYSKSGLILIHVKFNVMNLDMNFKYNEINFNKEII